MTTVARWARRLVVTVVSAAVLSVSGCAAADDTVRVLGRNIGKVDDLARDVPKTRLPGPVTISAATVQSEIDGLMTRLTGLAPEDRRQVTEAACTTKDLLEITSPEKAVEFGIQRTGTSAAYRSSVKALAEDLTRAESTRGQAEVLAVAAICQWAGS